MRIVSWCLLLLLPGPLLADDAKAVAVPFKLTDSNHIMVRVKLNGKGPFNLIMDTGAPAIFVTKAVAAKAAVKPDKDGWGTFAPARAPVRPLLPAPPPGRPGHPKTG